MTSPSGQDRPMPNILIVDDTPANITLLANLLKSSGYKVRAIFDGRLALDAISMQPPDLILLDIMMPGMDGYEVCERLKQDPRLKEIPVLFISALNETIDKVKGFRVGAVDYLTKPFQFEEVEARIRTHLEIQRQKRELSESYEKLRRLETLRDNLIHMVVHDMRSPLTVVSGSMELLEMTASKKLNDEERQWVGTVLERTGVLMEMVSQLLDISRMESGSMPLAKENCDLVDLASRALSAVGALAKDRHLSLEANETVHVLCDTDIVRRIILNLVGNAIKFTAPGGEIKVAVARSAADAVRVTVTDNGRGIPANLHRTIFEKFSQGEGKKRALGVGLGLAFCKLAVETHNGEIGMESEPERGSTFWFELPLELPASDALAGVMIE